MNARDNPSRSAATITIAGVTTPSSVTAARTPPTAAAAAADGHAPRAVGVPMLASWPSRWSTSSPAKRSSSTGRTSTSLRSTV